jgi:hypothetical protein
VSSALDRLPPLATTGVGSLPFVDAAAAGRHAVRAYDLPFCPQLPALDGDMVAEWLGADPRRCGWNADRDRERPAAWDGFRQALRARPAGANPLVKLQVTGPLTLATALERSGAARPEAVRALAGELATWLAANVAEQVRALPGDVLLVVDEPGLVHAPAGVADVWDPLRATGAAAWGLHVCGAVPWGLVREAAPHVLSFDVTRGLDDAARTGVAALFDAGTHIAWGVLDPVDPGDAPAAAGRAAACLSLLAGDRPVADVAARSLLTPACGTGRLSATRERLVAAVLAAAATATASAVAAGAPATGIPDVRRPAPGGPADRGAAPTAPATEVPR